MIATRNQNKAGEIAHLLKDLPIALRTLKEFSDIPDVEEDGLSLYQNARKKAVHSAQASGLWALADDTGLEVEALGGRPGVLSARYAGEECDWDKNNRKLLSELKGLKAEQRKAVFRCVIAVADPLGPVILEEGTVEGWITDTYQGDQGFGYDPVFYVPSLKKTLAEMSFEEKNKISHRAMAILKIKPCLLEWIRQAPPTPPRR